ncbi:hypothetical protein FRAHR75_430019 [Frankia sp. Hr75.2]|nr:hypothetical protein FRAHR75_430019 [Frankia sp. Hr75.2]
MPPVDGLPVDEVLRSVHRAARQRQPFGVEHRGCRCRHDRRLTCPSDSGGSWASTLSTAYLATSAPFRAQARVQPGMRPVIQSGHLEGATIRSAFLSPFGVPPFASWPSCSRRAFRLPRGRPTGAGQATGPMTGFPCSALLRYDRYRAPSIPRGRGAHLADIETPASTCRVPAAGPPPRCHFHLSEALVNEAYKGSRYVRPSGLPLAGNRSGGTAVLGLPPVLHTPPSPATHDRSGDECSGTHSQLTVDIRPSSSVN